GKLSGCVYRADGRKVVQSERFGGYFGDYVISDNPTTVPFPKNASRLEGRGLYLGHDMGGHYGHFLTVGLAAFWVFEEFPAADFDYILLHPFAFGAARPDYVEYCLQKFGLAETKIFVVGSEPLTFDELVVPERLIRPNHSADPRLRSVYTKIADGL